MKLKIAIGGDHAGYEYKQSIVNTLSESSHTVKDFGPFSSDSVDYPDFVHPVAEAVSSEEFDIGVLICGSGNGVAMTANKHKKIRAALVWNKELAELARSHNNANILCLPARFVDYKVALEATLAFIKTDFEGGRHARRVNKISHC